VCVLHGGCHGLSIAVVATITLVKGRCEPGI
jgi:hypothetical protein